MTEAAEPLPSIVHNEAERRFEAVVGDELATARYERDGDTMIFTHTHVPEAHEGQGIGSALAKAALEYALAENAAVVPACPFIAAYVERHPRYQHLVKADTPPR